MGESNWSLHVQARKHLVEANNRVIECNMMDQQLASQRGEYDAHYFRLKIVNFCWTSLDRHVKVAMMIQQRGHVVTN